MIQKTTSLSDLLLYYYNETGLVESDRLQRAIDGDPLIAADYNEMVMLLDRLSPIQLEPSAASVERILTLAHRSLD